MRARDGKSNKKVRKEYEKQQFDEWRSKDAEEVQGDEETKFLCIHGVSIADNLALKGLINCSK
jgi:hypothetical protein